MIGFQNNTASSNTAIHTGISVMDVVVAAKDKIQFYIRHTEGITIMH